MKLITDFHPVMSSMLVVLKPFYFLKRFVQVLRFEMPGHPCRLLS